MNLTTVKTQMHVLFSTIQQAAESGDLPVLKDVSAFLQLSEKMAMHAEETWHAEAEDFLHLTRQLHMVVKKNNFQEAVLLVEALYDAQRFCHKSFRADS